MPSIIDSLSISLNNKYHKNICSKSKVFNRTDNIVGIYLYNNSFNLYNNSEIIDVRNQKKLKIINRGCPCCGCSPCGC